MTEGTLVSSHPPLVPMARNVLAGPRPKPVAKEGYGWMDALFGCHMYLVMMILGFTYNLFDAKQQFLISALSIDILSLAFCFFRNIRVFIYGIVVLFLIVFYIFVFSVVAHVPLVLAQAGSYIALHAIGVFGIYARKRSLARAMWVMFLAALLYQLTFLYLRQTLNVDAITYARKFDPDAMRAVMRTHDALEGGKLSFRIFVADFSFAFAMVYAIARFRSDGRWIWFVSALFSLACFVLSDFRFAATVAALVFAFSLVPISTRLRLKINVVGNVLVMVLFLGFALTSFNMYEFFTLDATGNVRFHEVAIANELFMAHPWLGIGLAGKADDMYRIVRSNQFAASDIGYLGMLCRFGLIGYLGLLWINLAIPRFVGVALRNQTIPHYVSEALANLLIYVMLMQVLVTYMLDSGGALLIALVAGYWTTMRGVGRAKSAIGRRSGKGIRCQPVSQA